MADVRVRDFVYLDVEPLKWIVAQIEEGLGERGRYEGGIAERERRP